MPTTKGKPRPDHVRQGRLAADHEHDKEHDLCQLSFKVPTSFRKALKIAALYADMTQNAYIIHVMAKALKEYGYDEKA